MNANIRLGASARWLSTVVLCLLTACAPYTPPVPLPRTASPTSGSPQRSPAEVDRSNLAELAALRSIDLCGFVDPQGLAANVPGFLSYSYGRYKHGWVPFGYYEPHSGRGLEECTLRLADDHSSPNGPADVLIQLLEENPKPSQLQPQAFVEDGVEVLGCGVSEWACFVIDIPITNLAGAPPGMHAPRLTIMGLRDSSMLRDRLPEVQWIARMVARRLARGVPLRGDQSPSRLATHDPCASIADIPGKPELKWREPPDEAAEFTTWRLPYHCSILRWPDGPHPNPSSPDPANIVDVNFGFFSPNPTVSKDFSAREIAGLRSWVDISPGEPGSCHYFVQAGPVVSGKTATGISNAPEDQRIPVVEVRTYSPPCELAESIAVKAAQRAQQ